ncbi:MAG: type VI secretion system tip protein TssI/VgrG [Planctomycetota bacterium]
MVDIAMTQVMQFHSDAVDDGELQITGLEGDESISKPYEFRLELASTKPDIDFAEVLKNPAWIGIKQGVQLAGSATRAATTLKIHGVVESFEQIGKELEMVKYRAVLKATLSRLALTNQSRIFQDIKVPDLVKKICDQHDVIIDTGKLSGSFDTREYIVQYEESDLDFIHRWMEHEGIYYYFVQSEDHEKMVLGNKPEGYGDMQSTESLSYKPRSNEGKQTEAEDTEAAADDWFKEEVVYSLAGNVKMLPKEVILNDYNWRDPQTLLECKAEVSKDGKGIVYEYNDHYQTKEQGKHLAQIRAEAISATEKIFKGKSESRGFRAGLKFTLKDHYRNDFNMEYLLTEVKHFATQSVALGSGKGHGASYHNEFTAIPKAKSYHPPCVTPWPSIKGVMHARIDGGDSGTPYGQIDDKGRYKVKLPLDRGDAQDGNASKYVRKSEVYAGPNQGMHFPLLKDAEVLITHIDGDPDRPIISGAVYNEQSTTVVNNTNVTQNVLNTPGGNSITLDDTVGAPFITISTISVKNKIKLDGTDGSELITIENPKNKFELNGDDRITIYCENEKSLIRLGKKGGGSKAGAEKVKDTDGVWIGTDKDINQLAGGDMNVEVTGEKNEKIHGASKWTISGRSAEYKYSDWFSFKAAASVATSIGATAVAQIGIEAKVAYAASASVTRGDGFAATWGKMYKFDKSSSVGLALKDRKITTVKDSTLDSKLGNVIIDSLVGQVKISATQKIVLECGASKIEIGPSGIKLTSGAGAAGSRTTLGAAMTQIKGSNINIASRGPLSAKGTPGGQYK